MYIGILALILGNFLGAAITPTFVKLGQAAIPPFTFQSIRFTAAIIAFYPVYRYFNRKKFDRKNAARLLRTCLFFSCNILLFALGIRFTTALMATTLYSLVPLIVGLLTHFWLGDRLGKHKVLGAAIALAGTFFLFFQSFIHSNTNTFGTPLGNIIVLGAVICSASYYVWSHRLSKYYNASATSYGSYILTGIIAAVLAPLELIMPHPPVHLTVMSIGSAVLVGVAGTAAMYYLTQIGIKRTNPFTASIFIYTGPLFASLTAIPILHEQITVSLVIGGALILLGVFYATTSSRLFPG